MADIIEQMLVTLGLDTKDFDKARERVNDGLKRTAENAKKRGGDIEDSTKGMGLGFAKLRGELTGLLLTYAGAKSITSFTQNLVNNADQVGKTAAMYGKSTEEVSAWERVMEKAGGRAEEVGAAMQNLSDLRARMQIDRASVDVPLFHYLGINGSQEDIQRQLGDTTGLLLTLADTYQQRMAAAGSDPEKRSLAQDIFMKQVAKAFPGLTGDWFRVIEQGRPAPEEQLRLEKARGPITQEAADAARHFNESTVNLQQSLMIAADKAGLLTTWLGGLADVADGLAGSKKPLSPETSQRVAGAMVLREPEALLAMAAHGLGLISDETERKAIARALSRSEGGRNALAWAQHPDDPQPQRSGPPPVANSPTYNALSASGGDFPTGGGGSRPDRNNNPGDIIESAFARRQPGYVGSDGHFAIFSTPQAGEAAAEALVRSKIRRGMTLARMIADWAPPNENDTAEYIRYASRATGINPSARPTLAQAHSLAVAIARHEGYHGGRGVRAAAAHRGNTTINVDARGHSDPHAVKRAAHHGVRKALHRTHAVAQANRGLT